MKAALFVSMEHFWSVVEAGMLSHLLVCDRHEVVGLSYDVVHQARVRVSNSAVDEVTEISGVLVITIVDEFHLQNYIQEKLNFSVIGDLGSTDMCAVEHLLDVGTSFLNSSSLGWEL
jgi:hypothetical protein